MDKRKIRAYFCLVPVFGVIPSLIALLKHQEGQVKETAKVSLVLFFLWLSSYLALGGNANPETFSQIPGALMKATLASGYFVGSLWLMYRVFRNKPVGLPRIDRDNS
ncbi:MAG: hypothetical protein RMK91_08980 [Pseudanabaenaceae cyanobacterium SKYGB_i_bin29]|nr:hypothetical protein [Pseudanabaenaceae cyanobacterium SKYG29]MDW8421988.1 hypothetical protein [Pseudanabaenaceae cyanobacterium SKYGB_i_bin29]